jgi:hypothetical protein
MASLLVIQGTKECVGPGVWGVGKKLPQFFSPPCSHISSAVNNPLHSPQELKFSYLGGKDRRIVV